MTSRDSFLRMIKNMPVSVAVFDKEMRYVAVSNEWLRKENVTESQIIGKVHYDIVPQIKEEWKKVHLRCLEGESVSRDEDFYINKKGEKKWVRWKIQPWYSEEGVVEGAILYVEGLSDQKKAQEKLRQSEESFRQLAENINEVFWLVDWKTKEIIYISKAYERMYGQSCQSLYDSPKSWAKNIHPQDYDRISKVYYEKAESGEYDVEYRIVFENKVKWVRDRAFPIRNADGEVYRMAGISEDITDPKLLAIELTKSSEVLERKVRERTEKLEEINLQLIREVEERKRVSQDLYRSGLETKESIQYAQKIQEAILPKKQEFLVAFEDCFIINKPRDVVSGDFYWFHQSDNHVYVAVVDCTGHGVPGALMSMIGSELLDRLIIENKETSPSKILNLLNRIVVRNLRQGDPTSLVRDGMDMGLCVFNKEKSELSYSGAFNYLFHQTKNGLQMYGGNRFSVGGFFMAREKNFTEELIKVNPGDKLYMTTDGILDQFGGSNEKKFKRSGFEKLIQAAQGLSMKDQEKFFKRTLDSWQGAVKQLDDILIMGLQI